MSKTLIILLVVSLAVNFGAVVTFTYYWLSEGRSLRYASRERVVRGPEVRRELLKRRLGLTEDQIDAISREREMLANEMSSLHMESSERRRELMALMEAEDIDRARADSLLGEIGTLHADIERHVFEHLAAMRDLLTPEQQKHLLQLMERGLRAGGEGHPPLEERMERRMKNRPGQSGERGGDNGN